MISYIYWFDNFIFFWGHFFGYYLLLKVMFSPSLSLDKKYCLVGDLKRLIFSNMKCFSKITEKLSKMSGKWNFNSIVINYLFITT